MNNTNNQIEWGQHYTSVESFFSIISGGTIRLTRSEFLNDPTDTKISNIFISKFTKTHQEEIEHTVSTIGGDQASVLQKIYRKAPVEKYLRFIINKIDMYVMALSRDVDAIPMWNYYGRGGMELSVNIPDLVADLAASLQDDPHDYIGLTDVTYVDEQMQLANIDLPQRLGDFLLRNNKSEDLFKAHESFLQKNHFDTSAFNITNLGDYTQYFINSYIYTLRYLTLTKKTITPDMDAEKIFRTAYDNDLNIKEKYAWKSDVLLFFVMLSAALKNDSYKYEREVRIVYFNSDIMTKRKITNHFDVKILQGQQYIRPYIELKMPNLAQNISQITLAPQTENLPIDHQAYLQVVREFLMQHKFHNIKVGFSKRKIRW